MSSQSCGKKRTFRRHLLDGSRRHIRKEWTESFCYRRMDENCVSELPVWQVCQHCCLHRGQDFAGLGALPEDQAARIKAIILDLESSADALTRGRTWRSCSPDINFT